jgi:phosphohistidine phosphatase
MKLYLVRHGEALVQGEDSARPLTHRGRREAEACALIAARLAVKPFEIWHSGKARARETAEILAAKLGAPVRQAAGLFPNDAVEPWGERAGQGMNDLMLVGHLPFMERLASYLLTGDTGFDLLAFRTAAMACLARESGPWRLLWMTGPEMGL